MNGPTTLLILAGIIAFAWTVLRIVGRIASWRLTLTILTIAILTAIGTLNAAPILDEIDHAVTNLFGTPTEGNNP